MSAVREVVSSNDQKYAEAEQSRLMRTLMARLFSTTQARVDAYSPTSLLDAGCGEGHVRRFMTLPERYVGLDASEKSIAACRRAHPGARFQVGSVYNLDFPDAAFDVVLCMEVLEHLERPTEGLRELVRVAGRGVVVTVPFEPVFQLGNAMRGKYPGTWGNHPEHIQHWGRRSFPRFLEGSGLLDEVSVTVAGPWLVGSGRPRPGTRSSR